MDIFFSRFYQLANEKWKLKIMLKIAAGTRENRIYSFSWRDANISGLQCGAKPAGGFLVPTVTIAIPSRPSFGIAANVNRYTKINTGYCACFEDQVKACTFHAFPSSLSLTLVTKLTKSVTKKQIKKLQIPYVLHPKQTCTQHLGEAHISKELPFVNVMQLVV